VVRLAVASARIVFRSRKEAEVKTRIVLALFVFALTAQGVQAQLITWNCVYQDGGFAAEMEGRQWKLDPHATFGSRGFIITSDKNGTFLEGGIGKLPVEWINSGNALHFVELVPTGMNVITIYGQETLGAGLMPFVQSRHLDVMGPLPQMYFGVCHVEVVQ